MNKIKIDWLWLLVGLQCFGTLFLALGWRESTIFTLEHEDSMFIALLCTAFIRDAIRGDENESCRN